MVKRLRIRYTVTATLILLVVLITIGFAINLLNYYNFMSSTQKTMSIIAANNGEFPDLEDYNKMLEEERRQSDAEAADTTVAADTTDTEAADTDDAADTTDAEASDTDGADSGSSDTVPKDEASESSEVSESESDGKDLLDRFDYSAGVGFGLKVTAETAYETRYFYVRFAPEGGMIGYDLSHIAEIDVEDAEFLGREILEDGNESGVYGIYRYYRHGTAEGATEIIFLNCATQLRYVNYILFISVFTLLAVLAGVSAAIWFLSKKIVKPFSDNLEKQKRFITDAGHEIKTPLAIIDANAEVLKLTEGDNEWIDSIQNQTTRLSSLVKKLIALSKSEESALDMEFEKFNVSDALIESVSPFVILAKKNGSEIDSDIDPDVTIRGNEASCRQLFGILLDNAVKYSPEGGRIKVTLAVRGRCVIEFYNECDDLDTEKIPQLFDRFYRADRSRSRGTGGYGIGLSIARAIVDAHHGKISASSRDGKSITFTVVL